MHYASRMLVTISCVLEQDTLCRYDPYGRTLFREEYDQHGMRAARRAAIEKARVCSSWGIVLGTLGRQGNPALLAKIQKLLEEKGIKHSLVLLSEVMPHKLALMQGVDAWVQIACPRCACTPLQDTVGTSASILTIYTFQHVQHVQFWPCGT